MPSNKQYPFIISGEKITHRSAKGSKLRYQLDKICHDLTIEELEILLQRYDKRAKEEKNPKNKWEYNTCCKIIRDWINIKKMASTHKSYKYTSWNSEKGILVSEGKIITADYSEDESEIIYRDSEGNIIDRRKA